MKNKSLIILIVVLAIIVIASVTTATLAIWRENDHDSLYVQTHVADENVSVKYQMYVPVKSSGVPITQEVSGYTRLAGNFIVNNDVYSYTLTNPGEASSIEGFVLAGWFGGVLLDSCSVPSEVTVLVNGNEVTKPVVGVMVFEDYIQYGFDGEKTVIKNLVFADSVVEIDKGAFFGMKYLESVTFLGDKESPHIFIKQFAFGNCFQLKTLNDHREKDSTWDVSLVYDGCVSLT